MPTWGEILVEIQTEAAQNNGQVNLDEIRDRYMERLVALTGRSLIVYAVDMFNPNPNAQIVISDMQGMMEVFKDLPGPNLDLIIHSPGGQAEATDRIVRYLRSKFTHIRVFVPFAAMSAATMWAMAADEIVMGKHSQLGPIDPQITLPTGISLPAGALIDQFREAQEECAADPAKLTAWLPTLQQYPPGLLNFCESATELSKKLVAEWLETYMFVGLDDAAEKAAAAAEWLASDKTHLSHSRAITRDQLTEYGIKVTNLESESEPELQDALLSVHHALMHTLSAGSATKIIESHMGRRWVQHGGQMLVAGPPPGAPPPGAVLPGVFGPLTPGQVPPFTGGQVY